MNASISTSNFRNTVMWLRPGCPITLAGLIEWIETFQPDPSHTFLISMKAETLWLMNQGYLEAESTGDGWIRTDKPPSPASRRGHVY
jgi:hypothetical protein